MLTTLIYPKSRGTLRLASTDPTASPLIDFQYLADPSDLEVLAEGSEMVREIFAGAAFGGSIKGETHPGKELQGQALRDAILNRATSVYHGVGTCRMGVDELAVVGPDLKVRGVEGLRVCDASIMPSITGGNTNAPAIMIGEMGATWFSRPRTGADRMTLQRPASITDAFLDKLVARVPSTSGGTWKLTEVYTGEVLVELPQSTPEDVERAYAAARAAQVEWAARPLKDRLEVFKRAHTLFIDNAETTTDLIQVESGKNRRMAIEETCDPVMVMSHYLKRAPKLLKPVKRGGPVPMLSTSTEIRQPKGVIGIIAPWNFPFATGISDSISALMAGNGIVLKPDNKTALSPLYGVQMLEEAGLPKGLFQVVCGEGPDVGPTLIDNANYVMFTGSTATGRVIGERAGRNLIGACLELGGKNPMIVLEDANLDEVVQGAMFGAFGNTGQICMHIERMYLPARKYDDIKAGSSPPTEALDARRVVRLRARTSARWSRPSRRSGSSRTSTTRSPRAPPCSSAARPVPTSARRSSSRRSSRASPRTCSPASPRPSARSWRCTGTPPSTRRSRWPTTRSTASTPRSGAATSTTPARSAGGSSPATSTSTTSWPRRSPPRARRPAA